MYRDNFATVINSDCRNMSDVPDNSVHCVVTSPPYFGQRKYHDLPDLIWDSKPECSHEWGDLIIDKNAHHEGETNPGKEGYTKNAKAWSSTQGSFCRLCNAWKGGLGLEPEPSQYLQHLMQIMREIKRILRNDGVCFIDLDDKRSGGDLCLIPQDFFKLCQLDGWHAKHIIIWQKPSTMPESVAGTMWEQHKIPQCPECKTYSSFKRRVCQQCGFKIPKEVKSKIKAEIFRSLESDEQDDNPFNVDCPGCEKCDPNGGLILRQGSWRPTASFEYIFMLTKSDKYFSDGEAVREIYTKPLDRWGGDKLVANGKSAWDEGTGQTAYRDRDMRPNPGGRNLRDVWAINPGGNAFPGQHFAAYPPELPERCIKASTSQRGCCPKCGKQWARVIDASPVGDNLGIRKNDPKDDLRYSGLALPPNNAGTRKITTLAWKATCSCGITETIPATVLDPFSGTGTTQAVAKKLGRRSIGYELSPRYFSMIEKRLKQTEFQPELFLEECEKHGLSAGTDGVEKWT